MKIFVKYFIVIIFLGFFISCKLGDDDSSDSNDYSFELQSKYDTIISCPGGGGLFILKLLNSENQSKSINLQLVCDEELNASLHSNYISINQPVAEVLIKPDSTISISEYEILVIGERKNYADSIVFNVSILDWNDANELGEIIEKKMEEYVEWLNLNYPEVEIDNQTDWDIYSTYPQVLIVEHLTLLSEQYEMRILNHSMVPPEDWSMIRLRERKSFNPLLAAKQDSSGGEIYEISLDQYPTMYGY